MPTADPFSCFGGSDSESEPEDEGIESTSCSTDDEQGRRLREATNARQTNSTIAHVPVTSSGFEVFSCSGEVGFGSGQMGVRALRPYMAGEEIMRERPSLRLCTCHAAASKEEAEAKFDVVVQEAFEELSEETAAAVMDLSSCNEQDAGSEKTPAGVFNTNSYRLGDETDHGGLFLTVARMNHSCRPNASHHWRPDLHMMIVHAASDIAIGEEMCTCYGPGDCRDTGGRRSYLGDRYSFECTCDMCREGNESGGDDRMAAVGSFHDTIQLNMTSRPGEALASVEKCLALLSDQGIGNPRSPYVQPILHYGYQVCLVGLQDEAKAQSYLTRELLSAQGSQGPGSYKSIDLETLLHEMKAG